MIEVIKVGGVRRLLVRAARLYNTLCGSDDASLLDGQCSPRNILENNHVSRLMCRITQQRAGHGLLAFADTGAKKIIDSQSRTVLS
jgi:hypothetical protein